MLTEQTAEGRKRQLLVFVKWQELGTIGKKAKNHIQHRHQTQTSTAQAI